MKCKPDEWTRRNVTREVILWLMLFFICLGLGYPTLNRYDPRSTGGLSDTQAYYDLVTSGSDSVFGHMRFRVLVPLLARPLYLAAKGRTGTWEPVFLGFLIVNAFFTATTAWLLVVVGRRLVRTEAVALLAAALYLLNFEISNLRLSGMVDSAEGCFLMAIVWSLLCRRLWLLPVWGLIGAFGKETLAPYAIVFTAIWWFVSRDRERWKPLETAAILSTGLAALGGVATVQSLISGHVAWPWEFAMSMRAESGHLTALLSNILDRNLLYGFCWLLPIAVLRLNRFPRPWIAACAAAALADYSLTAYYVAQPGTAVRSLFSIAGPLLSLSAAQYLAGDMH